MTGLHWACKKNSIEMVKIILKYDHDINAIDLIGRSPLYHAI